MARKKDWDGVDRRDAQLVLVVGDEADSNELLSRILVSRGYRTAVATTPEEAMYVARDALPRAVVLDLATGGIGSNLKVLESLRSHSDPRVGSTRVVLVARSSANRVFSFQSGVDGFIKRPFHANELLELVTGAIHRRPEERASYRRAQVIGE